MSDLTQEQQQRVVERCADRGFTVAPSDDKPDSLQIIVDLDDPNDPLAKMENELFDQWLAEEAQRIEEMNETEWLSLLLGGFLAEKLFSSWENIFSSSRRKQPITLTDGTRCFTEDCKRHDSIQEAKNAVLEYKRQNMRAAQAHAKAILPREVSTPLPDVPLAALNGSDIKEMLNPKALFASARNGATPDIHIEAVLRTPELIRDANEVSRRAGGKKSRVVIKNGKEVLVEDPIAEIVELDAPFHAANKEKHTARYSVQKYKKPNMKPKIYFMYCRKA